MTLGMCVSPSPLSSSGVTLAIAPRVRRALINVSCILLRFLPSFFFVIAMHDMFMYLCKDPKYNAFFEGISAAVVGLISESACQLTKAAVHNGMDTLVFTCTLLTLTQSTNKNTPLLIIFAAAMAGQVLYLNNANSLSS